MLDNLRQKIRQLHRRSPLYIPTFPRFSELPVEIRLKIWHLAITPRAVQFLIALRDSKVTDWGVYYRPVRPSSRTDLSRPVRNHHPPALEVNSEARGELSPLYRKSFGFTDPTARFNHIYHLPEAITIDFQGVLFNHHVDTLCLHWPFTADIAKYCKNGLDNLQNMAVLVEKVNLNLHRHTPISFIEICLKCEKLESFRVLLAYSEHEHSTAEIYGKYHAMKLHRSLMRAPDIMEWTHCTMPWPEESSSAARQARVEECLRRWRTIVEVIPFKMPSAKKWQSSLDACLLG